MKGAPKKVLLVFLGECGLFSSCRESVDNAMSHNISFATCMGAKIDLRRTGSGISYARITVCDMTSCIVFFRRIVLRALIRPSSVPWNLAYPFLSRFVVIA